MKKISVFGFCCIISACSYFSGGVGQVVYHWERTRTGVEKFAKDHNECMLKAQSIKWIPNFQNWFYTQEKELNTRADWNSDKGIWATYIPYEGAQPLIVNSPVDDYDISPQKYTRCMKQKGYWYRTHTIPEITNINLYKEHQPNLWHPFSMSKYGVD